jgi:hypothetical protein
MGLRFTQPITEVRIRNFPAVKGQLACKTDLTKSVGASNLTTLWASTACLADRFTFLSNDVQPTNAKFKRCFVPSINYRQKKSGSHIV